MFNSVGWGELLLLLTVGIVVLGPERLPAYAADAARLLRRLRELATAATTDLREQLGPDLEGMMFLTPAPTRLASDPPGPGQQPTPPSGHPLVQRQQPEAIPEDARDI